jgi:hypothetical protein
VNAAASPKVPATPPSELAFDPAQHVVTYSGVLWRVFSTAGIHPQVWNELRHWGPGANMRFDPQSPPPGVDPAAGVLYAATLGWTALGEVFQSARVIDRTAGAPVIAAWFPSRELQLLDLTSNWPVVNGAAASMMMDDKQHTQAWARAIHQQLGDRIDGLWHLSSINSKPMVTLFSRVERMPAFPPRVSFETPLDAAAADALINAATKRLGYASV